MKQEIDDNRYELLSKTPSDIVLATEDIRGVLKTAVKQIAALKDEYPDAGIGDTATDEAIAHDFYSILHLEN